MSLRWRKSENRHYRDDVVRAAERSADGNMCALRVFWCWRRRWENKGYKIEYRHWQPEDEWRYVLLVRDGLGWEESRPHYRTLSEAKAAAGGAQ